MVYISIYDVISFISFSGKRANASGIFCCCLVSPPSVANMKKLPDALPFGLELA